MSIIYSVLNYFSQIPTTNISIIIWIIGNLVIGIFLSIWFWYLAESSYQKFLRTKNNKNI